jgi:hypothetical protein
VADYPDRQRIRPTVEGRARLLAAIDASGPPHVVDIGTLGEYAELVAVRGRAEADALLPEVATHLAGGCPDCADDLRELTALAGAPDAPGSAPVAPPGPPDVQRDQGNSPPSPPSPPPPSPPSPPPGIVTGPGAWGPAQRAGFDSGIHAADLPDPRAAEAAEAARRQRRRRLRDRLLIGAAVVILLVGLVLIGLAYRAGSQPGRAAPSGMDCPSSRPIKGNRSSMIYHRPGGEFYEATRPEECFASPADAEAAGYRASQR